MITDVMDLDGAYRRHAADQIAAALRQAYDPVVSQELPPRHAALLDALAARERNAREPGESK